MNKNNKSFLFLGITLLILLISMGSICAQDTNNTQSTETQDISTYHNSSISDYTTTAKEADKSKIIAKNKDNNTKNVKTTVKQTKKESIEPTTTVTDYETLKQSWNNIKTSENNETDYTINVKNGNYKFTEELEINTTSNIKSITINGENADKTIFDAQNMSRHFNLNTTTLKINFNNITFINGFNNNTGGSIYSKAVVNINNSKFINNTIIGERKLYGGAITLENNFTITYSLFENNSIVSTTSYSSSYGGALNLKVTNEIGNIINCEFINNKAPSANAIYVDSRKNSNNITIEKSIFYSKNPIFYSSSRNKPSHISYNYYIPSTLSSTKDLFVSVNDKVNFNMFNQKNSNVTIQLCKYEEYYAHPLSNITLGLNKNFKITSSSNLINTTGIELSPENNYTAVINISNLPAKHEDISVNMEGVEVAKVVYNYTNIEINNITSKAGKTITIKTKLTSNNKEAVQNGKVAFKLNGRTIGHKKVKVGFASLNYTIPANYSSKDYILSVVYGGSNDFIEARRNVTLKLEKSNTKTDVKTEISGNTLKININPTDENNKTITHGKVCVKINGKTQKTYTINGKSTYNFTLTPSWNNREMKIFVIYGENNNYKESRCEITTKITLPTKTQVKKDNNVINNYYISTENGLDTNPGTQSSPFKTIQKAITTIQANNQPSNIYLDGNFKGVGNTNLTIPGNLKINFIGVGNSSIDGEVNYTLSNGSGVWESSLIWESYYNGTGNWAMKITQGTGLITINNLTIKNCWNPGSSSISAYPTATVDNYGNLDVNNVSFIFNHGGVGAGIRNNNGATLTVNNSIFEANRKSSSTGNYGAGLYNNGTATVINSLFQKNYGRWGTITNDKNLTLINSTICDNIGYDGASTYKTGSGITINTGGTDYFNPGEIGGIVTVIDNCYFTNNDQLDIYIDEGCANITNCVFNKSTGINGATDSTKSVTNIINNTIISPQPSTLATSLSSSDLVKYALHLSGGAPYLIENNTGINLTCNAIEVNGMHAMINSIIRNNTFDNSISLNGGNNNTFENNNITTKQEYAIYLGTQSNTKVISNHLVSSQFEGDGAVSYQGNNIVANNTPKMALIRLNNENFYQYFDDDGNLKPEYDYIDQITIIGDVKDKTMIFNKTIKIGQQNGWPRITSNNITIIMNNGSVNITGLRILNTNNQPVFILNSDNNIITGSNLTTNNTYTVFINNTKNNTITGNILIADLLIGDESVKTTTANADNITENTPIYRNYIINDTTYNTYFNTDGTINTPEDKPIHLLIGDLNNKTLILNNNKDITLMNYHEIVAHNITIKTEANTTLNMTNITIINTNKKPVLEIRGLKTTITYTNLTSNDNVMTLENTKDIDIRYNKILLNVTGDVKAIIMKNVTNIQNPYNNNITIAVNITQDNKTHTIIAIEGMNLTNCDLSYFNINITNLNEVNDNIYAFNIINPEIYDTSLANPMRSNNIKIKGFNNVCAINMVNQTLSMSDNTIEISAKNTIAMNITTSKERYSYNGIKDNRINMISQWNNTGIILNSCENSSIIETNITNTMSENIIAIQLNNSTNIKLLRVVMNLNGNNINAVNLNNTNKIDITLSNITVNTKNLNQAPVQLNNAEETLIANNIIITTTENTIKVDEKSSKSLIQTNVLYALKLGDDSVIKEGNNYILISDNTPVKSFKNLLLNDYTYDAFFDEKGQLQDEIPSGANITISGNLYNRVLNITRPVNMTGANSLVFTNTTIIINAKNTNITNINMRGYDNTKIIINANNCNINIPRINMQNTRNENITLITLNGNNNNITITDITTINSLKKENNANITLLKITGKQNSITIGAMEAVDFTNSTAIILDNADKNYLNISGRVESIVVLSMVTDYGIIVNNSNYNNIITSTIVSSKSNKVGFILSNSSNNIIYNARFEISGKALLIENNSNYNKIFGVRISSSKLNVSVVSIINSSHNILEGNSFTTGDEYPVEVLNGFENEIKYNAISSNKYKGDQGVYQETISDDAPQNNEISENYNSASNLGTYIRINQDLPLKIHQTIILTANAVDYTSKGGNYTFFVNGEEIETVDTTSRSASINYTITGKEGDKLIVTVILKDSKVVTNTSVAYPIWKLNSTILLPNITSNNGQTTVTAVVLDEEGNIQTNGRVAFKVNGKTVDVVNINNGVAQVIFDSSKYSAKDYNLTAVYGGNSMTENSTTNATLIITKTTPKMVVETPVVKRTNNTKIIIKLTDDQENMIYGNTKVAVKLNGKTVAHTKSTNGIITLNMDLTGYKNSQYDITVVSGENNLYNTSRSTSILKIE